MKKWYNLLLLIINIILYLVIVALWLSIPDELTLDIAVTVFNFTLTLILIFINRKSLSVYYQSHQFQKLTETLVFIFLVFSLLSLGNYIAYKHPVQRDLSAYKINTLTDQTKSVLKNIKGEIKFKLFSRKQDSYMWLPLFEFYRNEKNDISIEKVDIDLRPDLVADYHITDAATLVIEYNGKRQYVTDRDELNITNGLIKISRESDPVVYIVQGHGEADLASSEAEGAKFIFESVKNSSMELKSINLISVSEIPQDAKAVIVWGPRNELQSSELKVLEKYLERKGNLLVALDPDLNKLTQSGLRKIIEKYRILVRNDIVIDRKNFVNGSNGSIPLIDHYDHEHEITRKFKGQSFYPLTSSIEEIPEQLSGEKGKVTFLFSSSPFPDSWGETSIKEIASQNAKFNDSSDKKGPLNLAAVYQSEKNKIAVFGNSTFVLNAYQKFGANYTMFINTLSWLIDEDRLISFNLPVIQSEPMFISPQQMGIIFYFSVLFSPLILFALSIYMYRRKRDL
jgi:ABC-type uncharacterized transport system involved in gliding motility auxiliary subunit